MPIVRLVMLMMVRLYFEIIGIINFLYVDRKLFGTFLNEARRINMIKYEKESRIDIPYELDQTFHQKIVHRWLINR
jgi:hypothetical protein